MGSQDAQSKDEWAIGTRNSKLALIQTRVVSDALRKAYPSLNFRTTSMATAGDKDLSIPLHSFDAKALWTKELEVLLLGGQLDMIVHSLKDMPTQLPQGCIIGTVLEREDPRDALVMRQGSQFKTLKELPPGSTIGTSSVRRSAQLRRHYPELQFKDVRGNVETRLKKLDAMENGFACIILAVAGLVRLGLEHRITHYLEFPECMHAVGQGALAVEIRANDLLAMELLLPLSHMPSRLTTLAERSLMRTLEGGCSVPIGVNTKFAGEKMTLRAAVTSVDGTESIDAYGEMLVTSDESADEFGRKVASALIEKGADRVLQKFELQRALVNA